MMRVRVLQGAVLCLASLLLLGVAASGAERLGGSGKAADEHAEAAAIGVGYLEIVTGSVDETCTVLGEIHGVTFGEPIAALGNARTAELANGGRLGVRAPMRATEAPIVRPYLLVPDIQKAVKAAEQAGATIAFPPMEIPGQGTFSIYILGGIEHGLWQL